MHIFYSNIFYEFLSHKMLIPFSWPRSNLFCEIQKSVLYYQCIGIWVAQWRSSTKWRRRIQLSHHRNLELIISWLIMNIIFCHKMNTEMNCVFICENPTNSEPSYRTSKIVKVAFMYWDYWNVHNNLPTTVWHAHNLFSGSSDQTEGCHAIARTPCLFSSL